MNTETLWEIRECFPASNWPIWSATFPDEGCLEEDPESLFELITRNQHRLKPDVVLLLLNPAGEEPSAYTNFHSTKGKHRDDLFRTLIDANNLDGAYMTDLVPDVINPDGGEVEPDQTDVAHFLEQLRILNQESYHILCFHHKVFPALREYFGAKSIDLPHGIESFTTEWDGHPLRVDHVRVPTDPHKQTVRKQLQFLSANRIR